MNPRNHNLTRRQFIHTISIGVTGLVLCTPWRNIFANTSDRSISFFHTHTGEYLKLTYFSDGLYHEDALQEINHYLRDFRTNEICPIDSHLLDILYIVQKTCNSNGTFEVISGYRSPKTNKLLREKGRGVARQSLHTLGKAIDVRLTDVKTSFLKKAAISLKQGGVGYYAKSDFVHIDTGRVRAW
jgi:uncharacterized protein YcbK (DUF882 family)